jgi:N,N'-diacetylchitobiose transport system permease protein
MATVLRRQAATEPQAPPRRAGGSVTRPRLLPMAMIAPAVLVIALILGYPLVRLVILSLQDFGPRSLLTGRADFAGAENFTGVLGDPAFWAVLLRTAAFTLACVTLLMVLGFLLAHLLMGVSPWVRVVTTACLALVWAMPMVAATLVWQWMYQPQYGVANWLLTQLRVFGDLSAHNWFSDPREGLALIVLLTVWKGLPFVALTMFAARSQIPQSLYEAATLDGAGTLATFRHITIPVMKPVLAILAILEVTRTARASTSATGCASATTSARRSRWRTSTSPAAASAAPGRWSSCSCSPPTASTPPGSWST